MTIWLAPFRYYQIKHDGKVWRDFVTPAAIAFGLAVVVLANLRWINFLDQGLIDDVNPMLAMLAGLYIAALTAVASLTSRNLDKLIEGSTPTIAVVERGAKYDVRLSRRRYLALLFGFLAYLCIFTYISGIVAKYAAPMVSPLIPAEWLPLVNFVGLFAYFFLLASIVVHSIVGIHYLQERIHREPPKPDAHGPAAKNGNGQSLSE